MSKENLKNEEAIKKLQDMITDIRTGMLCTHTSDDKHIHAVPMSTQEVDDNGDIWFLFSYESESYEHLLADKSVCLLYSDPGSNQFLSIHGIADMSRDMDKIDKYWNDFAKSWFQKEKDDPRLLVLKITPQDVHYWDTKSNKIVTLFKLAMSSVTGKDYEAGRSGDLEI